MHLEDYIIINAEREKVFQIAHDVENYHEFVPSYQPGKLKKDQSGQLIIEREAKINGKPMKWESKVNFYPPDRVDFEQVAGKLKGMKIRWSLQKLGDKRTKVTISHDFSLKPSLIGWILEKLVAAPKINKTTSEVLSGLKTKLEGKNG